VAAYAGAEPEAEAARTGLAVADVSAFAKLSLRGPGVPELVESLVPDAAALRPHGVAPVPVGPALACRLAEDHLLLLAATPATTALGQRLAGPGEGRPVVQTDMTSAYAGFWLLGPRLGELLPRLTPLDFLPASFPVNGCAETTLAGVEALLARSAELSVPSLRIYVAWDLGEYVWERLLEAGREVPVTPVGLETLDRLAAPDSPARRGPTS